MEKLHWSKYKDEEEPSFSPSRPTRPAFGTLQLEASRRPLWARHLTRSLLLLMGLVSLGGLGWWIWPSSSAAASASALTSLPPSQPAVAAPVSSAPPASVAAPALLPSSGEEVVLRLRGGPEGTQALVWVNGENLGSHPVPSELPVPKGGKVELTFAALAHSPVRRSLVLDEDQEVQVELSPHTKPRRRPATPPRQASKPAEKAPVKTSEKAPENEKTGWKFKPQWRR